MTANADNPTPVMGPAWVDWSFEDGLRQQEARKEKWFQNLLIDATWETLFKHADPDEGLRGIVHEGHLYWWSPWLGTHSDGMHWLRKSGFAGRDACIEMQFGTDGNLYLTAWAPSSYEEASAHPSLEGRTCWPGIPQEKG